MKPFKLAILIVVFSSCNFNFQEKNLPILSFKINEMGVKEYYTISYKDFTNQFNEKFTTDNIKNKVCIANFFFTRCPSICPPMRQELIKLAENLKDIDDFMIISHTIDMSYDSVEILNNYWQTTEIPAIKWQFLRSSEANTKAQAKQFMTNFRPNEDGSDFYHSSFVALIDKKQQIRGFYNTSTPIEMERLTEDIKVLID